MKEPKLEFYRDYVEGFTRGEVKWRETIDVPEEWWKDRQRFFKNREGAIQKSVVHVFDVRRPKELVMSGESNIRWMGQTGVAYVWAYERDDRWYYTLVFHNPNKRICSPEDAVNQSAVSGRPFKQGS
jgi:hypothetical protein